jgi:hypothetical protein
MIQLFGELLPLEQNTTRLESSFSQTGRTLQQRFNLFGDYLHASFCKDILSGSGRTLQQLCNLFGELLLAVERNMSIEEHALS